MKMKKLNFFILHQLYFLKWWNQDYTKMNQDMFRIDCLFATKWIDQEQHIISIVILPGVSPG